MKKYDLLIIGGGMVGLTLALAIRKLTSFTVAIVDVTPLTNITAEPDVRVSAINATSQNLFENLDVWQNITQNRAQAYQHMHIWDKAGYGKLLFDHDHIKSEHLGHIIENSVIRQALWQKAQQDSGIIFYTSETLSNIAFGDSEVFASFGQQAPIMAKLVVGADGANSWLRNQLKVPLTFRDYDHHAIVATVACQQGHQNTAWQVFLPTGPLAFLPLACESNGKQLASIVWSTSPEEAQRILGLTAEEFNQEITAAADGKLGVISLESERYSYPLKMRLAQKFIEQRAVLIGDAAHTIHPLAGQGVNLGLKDAAALAETLALGTESFEFDIKKLKEFERWRKNDAMEMITAMEGIKQVFTPQQKPMQVLRGLGMELLNNVPLMKKSLIKQALGYQSHMPILMKKIKC